MGKTLVLLLLIIAVAAAGLVWFDYLGVLDVKTTLAPVYRFFGLEGRSQPEQGKDELLNLDAERLAILVEADELRRREMEKQTADFSTRQTELEQMAAELETRQQALDEREQSMTASGDSAARRAQNVEQNARYLNGMPPDNAVAILGAMSDQDAIDVIKKTEELAQAAGTASIVSVWFQRMPAERAAELQRKMAERP
ncbi:MAG: flagellar protein FlbB [Spirochaetaceae bacterium]|jgi:flagellar protein FlbB|nr:flagellar protein FlbB [Spirochaetaceae bacterium]